MAQLGVNSEDMRSGQPVSPDQPLPASAVGGLRIASLDFIRGIAVMGILAANIVAFGQPFIAYMWPEAFLTPHGESSNWMWVGQFVLIDGKMRGLFTLLFGAGMMLFLEKAWERGSGTSLQARRLCWLLLFGLIHFYLIWRGDILILYSVAGFAGLACVRWTAKAQLKIGLTGYFFGAILYALMMIPPYLAADTALGENSPFAEMREAQATAVAEQLEDTAAETAILTEGSYLDYARHNLTEHATDPFVSILIFLFETLPLMLIGMALYRLGLFAGRFDPARQRNWAWAGIISGSVLTLFVALWALDAGLTYWGTLAAFVGASPVPRLPVVLGLAALLALWAPQATGWLGQRVSAAGRMAFSNYLGTSILMTLLFHGWALGLFGQLNRPQLYLVVLGTWVIMLLWSKPWLEHFRYGPLEWLWRCLTYWKMFPLRK